MSKQTVSAAGGAMPAEGQQPEPAAERMTQLEINDAYDAAYTADLLVHAAVMACNEIDLAVAEPLQSVLAAAREKLDEALAKLDPKHRQSKEAANV